jgi:hypothetical protein
VPLSRPKKNITRDFSDGVMMAEVVKHFFPKMIDMHNYGAVSNIQQKQHNWLMLNHKVFKRMGFNVAREDIEDIVRITPGSIERVLRMIQNYFVKFTEMQMTNS